jgi:hypothetical protein
MAPNAVDDSVQLAPGGHSRVEMLQNDVLGYPAAVVTSLEEVSVTDGNYACGSSFEKLWVACVSSTPGLTLVFRYTITNPSGSSTADITFQW